MPFTKPPIKQYAIHHTAVSRAKQPTQLYAVNRYHQNTPPYNYKGRPSTLGWWVGYNYFIDVDGTVTNTRVVGEETIANVGHNCDALTRCDVISVCLAGDFNIELPSDAQIASLKKLVAGFAVSYPGITHTFHREIQPARTCPGALYTHEYHKARILEQTSVDDHEDTKKKEEIAKLVSRIDYLRALLAKLLAKRK